MSVEKNVPAIRFKGFSGDWLNNPIGNICGATFGGGTPSTGEQVFWQGDIPWIQSSDIKDGSISSVTAKKYITKVAVNKSATKLVSSNSIAIVTRVGVGKLSLMECEYATSQDFLSLSELKVDAKYSAYVIWKQLQGEKEQVQGTSIKGITKDELLRKSINHPELGQEQTQIGSYFQKLDNLINQHQQKHDKFSSIKKAMLEKMFPKQGETIPEIRFKGFSGEWESLALGENARFTKGQGYSKSDLAGVGTPIILYGRLYTKYQTVISQIDTFVNEKTKSLKSIGGEVIVPASGESPEDIARASVVSDSGVILGGDLNVIYPNNKISPMFLALVISNGHLQKELSSKAQGKSVVHVRNGDLENLALVIPEKQEQAQIGNYFQKLDALINQHHQQITKLNNIKQACLSKMFV